MISESLCDPVYPAKWLKSFRWVRTYKVLLSFNNAHRVNVIVFKRHNCGSYLRLLFAKIVLFFNIGIMVG